MFSLEKLTQPIPIFSLKVKKNLRHYPAHYAFYIRKQPTASDAQFEARDITRIPSFHFICSHTYIGKLFNRIIMSDNEVFEVTVTFSNYRWKTEYTFCIYNVNVLLNALGALIKTLNG